MHVSPAMEEVLSGRGSVVEEYIAITHAADCSFSSRDVLYYNSYCNDGCLSLLID